MSPLSRSDVRTIDKGRRISRATPTHRDPSRRSYSIRQTTSFVPRTARITGSVAPSKIILSGHDHWNVRLYQCTVRCSRVVATHTLRMRQTYIMLATVRRNLLAVYCEGVGRWTPMINRRVWSEAYAVARITYPLVVCLYFRPRDMVLL